MAEIFYVQDENPTDEEILSFWQMIFAPDQTRWDFEEDQGFSQKSDEDVIHFFRNTILTRKTSHAFWAREDGQIAGMAAINQLTGSSRVHCAELGFSVRKGYQRRGMGYHLVCAVLGKAREIGLERIECSCFADNEPAAGLLRKAGFWEEGLRTGAIQRQGKLRDIRLFGLLLNGDIRRPTGA